MELPPVAASNKLMLDASRHNPKMLKLDPMRAQERHDTELATCRASRMDNCEPNRDMPYTETEDPMRAKVRTENAEPMAQKSSRLKFDPSRHIP
jgi:hypothetical protein